MFKINVMFKILSFVGPLLCVLFVLQLYNISYMRHHHVDVLCRLEHIRTLLKRFSVLTPKGGCTKAEKCY